MKPMMVVTAEQMALPMARLEGVCAFATRYPPAPRADPRFRLGEPRTPPPVPSPAANPYPKGDPRARAFGQAFEREALVAARRLGIPRETREETEHPGRGRPRLGRRSEWRREEDWIAIICAACLGAPAVGRILGRPAQGVRNRLHRLRRSTCSHHARRSSPGISA